MIIHLKKNIRLDVTLPIGPVSGFTSSALPLEFVDIPGEICGAAVVAVAVTVTNADGVAATAPCEHADGVWRVIFAASCFEHYGYVESGVSVALTLRDGSGNERRMVLAVGDLEVKRSSPSAAPGDPEKSYQIKGEDIYVKTRVIDGVQHYARQEMSYDAEMSAWGADWLGDYILVDGEFVPFQAAGGTAATVATALLALLLVPFSVFGITATKEYVDRKDGEIAALSTNIVTTATNAVLDAARGYTDTAISQIPPPDFSTNNTELVETIHQTEVDPTVPAWAKKTVGDFYSDNLYMFVNRDFYANDSSIKSQYSIWLKGDSKPTVTVGRDKISDNTYPYTRQTVLGFSAYEGFDYYAHYRPRGIYIWPWWNEDAANYIAYLFPTNGNGGTFALTSDFSTNNTALVETIEATAPAPGDYATVSNAAINALSRAEAGLSAWSLAPSPQAPWSIQYERANGSHLGGWSLVIDSQRVDFYEDTETATTIPFTDYTATRTLLPTRADVSGKQDKLPYPTNAIPYAAIYGKPTNVSAFENDAGYLTGYTESDPTVPQWAKAQTKPTYTASEVGATTPADVTAAIREQSLGGIWDEALQVWWTPRMRNGSLTYEATTNVNLNAEN